MTPREQVINDLKRRLDEKTSHPEATILANQMADLLAGAEKKEDDAVFTLNPDGSAIKSEGKDPAPEKKTLPEKEVFTLSSKPYREAINKKAKEEEQKAEKNDEEKVFSLDAPEEKSAEEPASSDKDAQETESEEKLKEKVSELEKEASDLENRLKELDKKEEIKAADKQDEENTPSIQAEPEEKEPVEVQAEEPVVEEEKAIDAPQDQEKVADTAKDNAPETDKTEVVQKKPVFSLDKKEEVHNHVSSSAKTIAVAGSQRRIGATTQALQLCQYLNAAGQSACYVEKNQTGYVSDVKEWYVAKEKKGAIIYGGIHMFRGFDFNQDDWDYIIIDYGCHFDRDDLLSNDMVIFVTGTGAGEMTRTSKLLNEDYKDVWYLFNLVPENEDKELSRQLGNRKIIFSSYSPDPFVLGENEFKELKLADPHRKKRLLGRK